MMGEFSIKNDMPDYFHSNFDEKLYDPVYAEQILREGFACLKEMPIVSYPAGDIHEFSVDNSSTMRLSYWLKVNCRGVKAGCVQLGKVMHVVYMEEEHEVDLNEMISIFNNFMKNNRIKFIQQIVES